MSEQNDSVYDEDREEVLRLILTEASGTDSRRELEAFPVAVRNTFRRVVLEAGLVQAKGLSEGLDGEMLFDEPITLTPRGRKRLNELNGRRGGTNGHAV